MNLTSLSQNRKFFILGVIVISLLFCIIITASIFSTLKKPKEPALTSPPKESLAPNTLKPATKKPEELPQSTQTIRQKIISSAISDYHGDLLLYQGSNFKIEYITSPKYFFVTITNDPADLAKKEAELWFTKFGLAQKDLCELPVRFILSSYKLRQSNPKFSSSPTGCS